MQSDPQIISALNRVLTRKLTAINQYFLHARMYKNWGFNQLNSVIYKASIEEMKHADVVIERILFLQGLPNLQELGKLYIGEEPAEMLKLDLKMQVEDAAVIRETMTLCETHRDYVSRDQLGEILEQQEAHQDWLDTQLDLVSTLGVEKYLQSKL